MAGVRRKARIASLQALYECDCVDHDPVDAVVRLAKEKGIPEDAIAFARDLVIGVSNNKEELDAHIQRFAPSFPVQQISLIDRAILRMAIFEMMIDRRVGVKVAINEAVELAKTFGNEKSPKFVNGVLGAVSTMVP